MSESAATSSAVAPDRGYHATFGRWAWTLTPVWTAMGALLLDVFRLGRRSLRFEEAQGLAAADGSWRQLWEAIRDHDAPHAVSDTLLAAWLPVAGDGTWAVRLPSAVAGALAVGLTCALGTRLLGRTAGLLAAGVLGTSALVVAWSQTARGESLTLAAVVLSMLAFVAALEQPRWWRWALWALATALAVAASLLAAPVVAAQALGFLIRRPRVDWTMPVVGLAGVTAVTLLAAGLVAASSAGTIVGGLPDGRELGLGLWRAIGSTPIVLAIAGLGLFVLLTGRLSRTANWQTALLAGWLVIPALAALALSLARASFDPRYTVAAAPALALLAAAGVIWAHGWLRYGLLAALVASAVVTLALWYAGPSREDWRGAVAAIRAGQQPGEAVLVLPARRRIAAAYYAGTGYVVERPHGHRVWLLLAEDDAARRLELARKLVRPPRYALLEERDFGADLWLQVWAEP